MNSFEIKKLMNLTGAEKNESVEASSTSNSGKIKIFVSQKKKQNLAGVKIENADFDTNVQKLLKAQMYKDYIAEIQKGLVWGRERDYLSSRKSIEGNIISSFVALDIKEQAKINEILNNLSQQAGYDFPLELTQKDKKSGISGYKGSSFYISRMSRSGNRVPATNEQLSFLAKKMSENLDLALADALDVKIKGNESNKEVKSAINDKISYLNQKYKSSFKENYGENIVVSEGWLYDDTVNADDYINSQYIKVDLKSDNKEIVSRLKETFLKEGLQAFHPNELPEVVVTGKRKNDFPQKKQFIDMLKNEADKLNDGYNPSDLEKINIYNAKAYYVEGFNKEPSAYKLVINKVNSEASYNLFRKLMEHQKRLGGSAITELLNLVNSDKDCEIAQMLIDAKNKDNDYKYDTYKIIKLMEDKDFKNSSQLLTDKEIKPVKQFVADSIDDYRAYKDTNILADKEKIKKNIPIVPSYENGTSLEEISKKTPVGELAEVNSKLYCKDGNNKMIELKMSKEKYFELFPPVDRFDIAQNGLGDCWLVATMDNLMHNPDSRAELYKLFEQDGDDVYVKLPRADYSVKFPESKVKKSFRWKALMNRNQSGCKGLQMIEQAFAFYENKRGGNNLKLPVTKDENKNMSYYDVTKVDDMGDLMQVLEGGYHQTALEGLLENVKVDTYYDKKKLRKILDNFSYDSKTIYYFSTHSEGVGNSWGGSDDHDLIGRHAYSIKGYDKESGTILISNPWKGAAVTKINLYDFLKSVSRITVAQLK